MKGVSQSPIFLLLLLLLLVYPYALTIQLLFDAFLGDSEFLTAFMHTGKSDLAGKALQGWIYATAMAFFLAIVLLVINRLGKHNKIFKLLYAALLLLLIISPFIPHLPLMPGLIAAFTAIVVWTWTVMDTG